MERGKLVYLAAPYSHPKASVQDYRFRHITEAAYALFTAGYTVINPVAMVRALKKGPYASEHELNEVDIRCYGLKLLCHCEDMVVLCLSGWEQSGGLTLERMLAKERGINLYYCDSHTLTYYAGDYVKTAHHLSSLGIITPPM
jgi:hypothetical protein